MFSAKFIYASADYSSYTNHVASPYFRKTFEAASDLEACSVVITGLGFYDLFINGRKITKGLLAPYISNPEDLIYYDAYDLKPYLKEGKNVLGIQLGNGFMNAPGGQIWDFEKAAFRGAPRTAFSLEMKAKDGSVTILEADESVKTAPSPIFFDDERAGCFYDARKEIKGWCDPDFDDSEWKNAVIAPAPKGEPRLCEAEPILVTEEIKPVSIRKAVLAEPDPRNDVDLNAKPVFLKDREGYLYDFGIDTAGIVRLKIKGEKGQQVDLQFCEYIDSNDQPSYANIHFYPDGYTQRDIYILKGEGEEVFEPAFTYHGYRYCVVLGITEEQAQEGLLTMLRANSALKARAEFSCSDESINTIQKMVRNSDLSNFYYFPTDCPHREKNGWTGDAAVSCEHMLLNLTVEQSLKEWCRSIVKSQNEAGALPGIVPTGGWGFAWGNGPAWDAVITFLPYLIYQFTGDTSVLAENADCMARYMEYAASRRSEDGTIAIGLGDWVPITTVRAPLAVTDSITVMAILERCAFIFNTLGQKERAERAVSLRKEFRDAVRRNLVDFKTMRVSGNCTTSQAMGLYFGVFEPEEKETALKELLAIIEEDHRKLDCGFLGLRYLPHVLAENGYADLALEMLMGPEFPSYGDFIQRGYTSVPEAFFPADRFTPPSLNHHFLCDISAFFLEYIAGFRVNPNLDDPFHVTLSPIFMEKIDHADASFAAGGAALEDSDAVIRVHWEKKRADKLAEQSADFVELTVQKGKKVHGEILLPAGYHFCDEQASMKELESGTYRITR